MAQWGDLLTPEIAARPRPSPPPREQCGWLTERLWSEGRCWLSSPGPTEEVPITGSALERSPCPFPRARPSVPRRELWPLWPTGSSLGVRRPRSAHTSEGNKALIVSLAVNLTGLQETPKDKPDAAPPGDPPAWGPALSSSLARAHGGASHREP